jgi:hypothetical protein
MNRTMKMLAAGLVAGGVGLAASAAEPVKAAKPVAAQTKAVAIAKAAVQQPTNDSRLLPRPSQDQPPKSRDIIGGGSKVKNGAEPRDARLPAGNTIDPGDGKRPQPVNRGLGRDHTIPDMRDIGAGWQGLGKQVHLTDLGRDAKLNNLVDPRSAFPVGTGKAAPGRQTPGQIWDGVNPILHNGDGKNHVSNSDQHSEVYGRHIDSTDLTGTQPAGEPKWIRDLKDGTNATVRPDRRDAQDPHRKLGMAEKRDEMARRSQASGGGGTPPEQTTTEKVGRAIAKSWAGVERFMHEHGWSTKYDDDNTRVRISGHGPRGRPTPDDVDDSHAPKQIRLDNAPASLTDNDVNRRRKVSQPGEGRQLERMYVDRKELSEAFVGRRTDGRSTPAPGETDTGTGGDRTKSLSAKYKPRRPDGPDNGPVVVTRTGPHNPPGSNPDPEGGAGAKGDGSSTDDKDGSRQRRQ